MPGNEGYGPCLRLAFSMPHYRLEQPLEIPLETQCVSLFHEQVTLRALVREVVPSTNFLFANSRYIVASSRSGKALPIYMRIMAYM